MAVQLCSAVINQIDNDRHAKREDTRMSRTTYMYLVVRGTGRTARCTWMYNKRRAIQIAKSATPNLLVLRMTLSCYKSTGGRWGLTTAWQMSDTVWPTPTPTPTPTERAKRED